VNSIEVYVINTKFSNKYWNIFFFSELFISLSTKVHDFNDPNLQNNTLNSYFTQYFIRKNNYIEVTANFNPLKIKSDTYHHFTQIVWPSMKHEVRSASKSLEREISLEPRESNTGKVLARARGKSAITRQYFALTLRHIIRAPFIIIGLTFCGIGSSAESVCAQKRYACYTAFRLA